LPQKKKKSWLISAVQVRAIAIKKKEKKKKKKKERKGKKKKRKEIPRACDLFYFFLPFYLFTLRK